MFFKIKALILNGLSELGLFAPNVRFVGRLYLTGLWLFALLGIFLFMRGAVSWPFVCLAALAFLSDVAIRLFDHRENNLASQIEASQAKVGQEFHERIARIESNQAHLNNVLELATGPARF